MALAQGFFVGLAVKDEKLKAIGGEPGVGVVLRLSEFSSSSSSDEEDEIDAVGEDFSQGLEL